MFLLVALLVKIGIVILLWGRRCVFACRIACENKYCHSALGGVAAPSPQSPLPLFFFQDTKTHLQKTSLYILCIFIYTKNLNTETYTDVFACSIACENTSCHSALGEALRPPPNPPFRFSSFQDTKTHLHETPLCTYIYIHINK